MKGSAGEALQELCGLLIRDTVKYNKEALPKTRLNKIRPLADKIIDLFYAHYNENPPVVVTKTDFIVTENELPMIIQSAVNSFGGDHQSSAHDPVLTANPKSRIREFLHQVGIWKGYSPDDILTLDQEKVRFAYNTQCFYSLADSLCLCQFVWGPSWQLYGPTDLVDLCRSGLGWETSLFELMLAGERRINMMRFFNSREGFTRDDDTLPERLFKPLPDGPSKGVALNKEDFEKSKDLYYQFAGWGQETGNPQDSTLKRLSLDWLLEE